MTATAPLVRTYAPGRVNLIGEHTDYSGGLALPIAIQLGTTVTMDRRLDGRLRLTSDHQPTALDLALPVVDPTAVRPSWGRYAAAVAAELDATTGFDGAITTTLPVGAGLSSSASLEVALTLALGSLRRRELIDVAAIAQRAEHRATGVPCGIIDQLASLAGRAGHALLIDCSTLEVTPTPLPEAIRLVLVDSGERRSLEHSAYGERRRSIETAAALVGPLNVASIEELSIIDDPLITRRARHVITENQRVRDFVTALAADDAATAGQLMVASHHSLRDDFEVSTPRLDSIVNELMARPDVYGARLTGAGFGGCVIALCEPGAEIPGGLTVEASPGARIDVY